jgi:hypothetical protein
MTAELACYGVLPWIQTRPPADVGLFTEVDGRDLLVRRLNQAILRSASIRVNTLPSGHASGSLATALAAGAIVPVAFAPLLVLAISVAAGSVVGRYHYSADSVLGILVALAAWATLG